MAKVSRKNREAYATGKAEAYSHLTPERQASLSEYRKHRKSVEKMRIESELKVRKNQPKVKSVEDTDELMEAEVYSKKRGQ